ncbi:MAG: metallophosphoesterase [Clostridia bacterium]|nr:metallophosphoesterase [Clostridia bacterium]
MLNIILIIIGVLVNAICIWSIKIILKDKDNLTWKSFLKYLLGIPVGALLSLLLFPLSISTVLLFASTSGILGELLSLFFLTVKQSYSKNTVISYYDDGSPAKFFITGDKHRHFDRVKEFCREMNTRRKDVLIVLGDAGFNFYDDKRDDELKQEISKLNITLFCLHGNKENRPQNVGTYGIRSFCGGKVYYEPQYPNIYFAIDGEIYTFEGKKYMVVGGAHSVDKMRCLEEGTPFWFDEMPDDTIKAKVELGLQNQDNKIFGMMTHTCPIDYLPTEMFMSTRQNASIKRRPHTAKPPKKLFKPDIDRSTEIWLGELEKKLEYEVWFCGHYHIDKQIDKIQMMCHDIRPLHMQLFGDE